MRALLAPRRLEYVSLALLAVIFLIRFPVHFLFSSSWLMDFDVYRFAAELVRTDQGARLYHIAYAPGMYFKYAPLWALLWSPLGYLSTHLGGVLWSCLSVGWLLLTLWCAGRIVGSMGLRFPFWVPLAAVVLLVRPLLEEFGNGQANLWWGGLTTLFVYLECRRRPWLAALSLALAILLKLPALILLPYLLVARRWGSALRTLAWLGLLVPLGAFAVDPHHMPAHMLAAWGHLLAATSPEQAFQIGDQSLHALLARVLTADGYGLNLLALSRPTVLLLALLTHLCLFAMITLPWSSRDSRNSARLVADVSMVMILMVIASPSGWLPTYSILLFPTFLAITQLTERLRRRQADAVMIGIGALMGLLSLMTSSKFWKGIGVYSWRAESYVYLVFMTIPLYGLVLLGLLWYQRRVYARSLGTIGSQSSLDPSFQ